MAKGVGTRSETADTGTWGRRTNRHRPRPVLRDIQWCVCGCGRSEGGRAKGKIARAYRGMWSLKGSPKRCFKKHLPSVQVGFCLKVYTIYSTKNLFLPDRGKNQRENSKSSEQWGTLLLLLPTACYRISRQLSTANIVQVVCFVYLSVESQTLPSILERRENHYSTYCASRPGKPVGWCIWECAKTAFLWKLH